jgi:aryl-alcohol dehydrogenase-like predicted oxidoreductase
MRSVEESLRRLGTDYIDLYYLHYPDPETPSEETLRTLDGLVQSGKVRYIACSNFAGWQLADAVWTSKLLNLESFIAVQSRYNLIDRSIEKELVPCCEAHGVGVIPWGPLASGFLTGKHERGRKIDSRTRLATPSAIYSDILTDENFDKLERLQKFAKERGHSVGELAIAWLLSRPYLGSVIAGAMNGKQLSENVKAANWKLTAQDVSEIDKIT